ncbi:toll/interleukin-1 receptor domain-containing protein [Achromobacter xylosoxidans]|uniref:toll/interleukin-1 receptor domain-containing protein n=1 Tax=Alcaligenes xylosoxydans xylosoxydans TaxID=85698 RepID=UPI001F1486EB|nr:toll/interleukin-1 receptor domain-containing protein [Achromobacter xylosoxidans]
MSKVFLSHNSFDKDFVGRVYDKLGALLAVYDKETFRRNCDLAEQIREGIEGCEIYVLFLSKGAIDSGWVQNELDLANEFKTKWGTQRFLIFQLDDTEWSNLPRWAARYVVSCMPSPELVALRIKEELRQPKSMEIKAYGRELDIRNLNEMVLEMDEPPRFLFFSGPVGCGRKTIASELYQTLYKTVSTCKINITINSHDDIRVLHRQLLAYTANWRARELYDQTERFAKLPENSQIKELAGLIYDISVGFQQILFIDFGAFAVDSNQRPLGWLVSLLRELPPGPYPYLTIISNRNLDVAIDNGVFYHVKPLDDDGSRYLFKVMLSNLDITFPSKKEKDNVENSVIGHPGLIVAVVNYLKLNPHYRPNKTHNSIIQLVRTQVEKMLLDFVSDRPDMARAVAFLGEVFVLSYSDIVAVGAGWPGFDDLISQLLDAGFLVEQNANYQLAPYIQRHAQKLAGKYFEELASVRKILFEATDVEGPDSFVAPSLLDARIVAHFVSGTPLNGYMSNLVMPAQQLRAAKREYDSTRYKASLSLSKDAYEQKTKLSDNGLVEAWRLIGLSAIRIPSEDDFIFFAEEYKKIPRSKRREASYNFAHGLKARLQGNLRDALPYFVKIIDDQAADAHCLREAAYIYAFDGRYDEASKCIGFAGKLAPANPYVVDIEAFILLERYRQTKDPELLSKIESCLERLEDADRREDTNFSSIRKSMRDVFVYNQIDAIRVVFNNRMALPIHAKLSLLDTLSSKGKGEQYGQLRGEIERSIRSTKNRLAEIELARIEITHLAYESNTTDAEKILAKFRAKFTQPCVDALTRLINGSKAQAASI